MSNAVSFEKEFAALQEVNKRRSVISLQEFIEFAPLYVIPEGDNKNILTDNKRAELSNKLFERINIYNELNIVDNNGNVLFTLPRIFIPVKSIAFDNEAAKVSSELRRSQSSPKSMSEAAKSVVELIIASQAKSKKEYSQEIKDERDRYSELLLDISKKLNAAKNNELVEHGDDDDKEDEIKFQETELEFKKVNIEFEED